MVAKKMTILMLLCALLLPALSLAAGAAANVRANVPPPPNGPENNYMQSPEWVFFSACTAGDLATLSSLVGSKPDLVRFRLPDGKIGLHLAVLAAKRGAAEFLLNRGSDVNARDMYDKTPLFYAYNHCDDRSIAALIRNRGGIMGKSKLYYGDGQFTLYRNCAYLGCPSCYWESRGGYPEGTTLPGARPPANVTVTPTSAAPGGQPVPYTAPAPLPPPAASATDTEEGTTTPAPAPMQAPAAASAAPTIPAPAAPKAGVRTPATTTPASVTPATVTPATATKPVPQK